MNNAPFQSVELVVTTPEPYGTALAYHARCRTTLGVLCQLLAQAESHVIIASPFMQAGHGLMDGALSGALRVALQRGVNVDVLSTGPGLKTIDRACLASGVSGDLRFFRPAVNIADEQRIGSHAKFCVADGRSAYVGSANLTGPGLSGQIEVGLLVHGEIATRLEQFWTYFVQAGLFVHMK